MALQVDVLMYWSGSPVTVSLTFWSVFVTGGVVDAIMKKPLWLFAAVSDEQQSISASLAQTTSRRYGKLFTVLPKQSVTLLSERDELQQTRICTGLPSERAKVMVFASPEVWGIMKAFTLALSLRSPR